MRACRGHPRVDERRNRLPPIRRHRVAVRRCASPLEHKAAWWGLAIFNTGSA